MTVYCIIENGRVTNRTAISNPVTADVAAALVADWQAALATWAEAGSEGEMPTLMPHWTIPAGVTLAPETGEIGDLWDGTAFTRPAPPAPVIEDYERAVSAHIEATARECRYSSSVSIVTYLTSTVSQFAAEAQAFLLWRDAVEVYAYAQLDAVLAGQRTQPTVEELIDEIKTQHPITWPV
jgi:hypothetical protein